MKFFEIVLLAIWSFAVPNRISEMTKDLGRTDRIYLSPGLSAKVEFQGPITEVLIGNPQGLKAPISTTNPKVITPYLTSATAPPTNLIVTVGRKVYVFDVIPSKATHQDYIRVRSTIQGAAIDGEQIGVARKKVPNVGATLQTVSLGGAR